MQSASHFMVTVLVRGLELMFAIGVVGSAVVIILATVEDVKMMMNKD